MKTATGQMLEIRSLPTGQGTVIVALTGRVDASSAPVLEDELVHLHQAGPRRIVIDATDLTFIDPNGLTVLVDAHRAFVERGGGLEIYNASPVVGRTLDRTGVAHLLQSVTAIAPAAGGGGQDDPSAA